MSRPIGFAPSPTGGGGGPSQQLMRIGGWPPAGSSRWGWHSPLPGVSPTRCIPDWYRGLMSTQIAFRLPDELVAYVDQAVAAGRVKSRAELVSRLIARDARRQRAEEDLQRLIDAGALEDGDALAMARATSATTLDD